MESCSNTLMSIFLDVSIHIFYLSEHMFVEILSKHEINIPNGSKIFSTATNHFLDIDIYLKHFKT